MRISHGIRTWAHRAGSQSTQFLEFQQMLRFSSTIVLWMPSRQGTSASGVAATMGLTALAQLVRQIQSPEGKVRNAERE